MLKPLCYALVINLHSKLSFQHAQNVRFHGFFHVNKPEHASFGLFPKLEHHIQRENVNIVWLVLMQGW